MSLYAHPAAGWQIRAANLADFFDIEDVFRTCLKDFSWRNAEQELDRLHQTLAVTRVFVAEELSAGIVGFLTLERKKAYVPHLFVHPDWRFCGVGSGLLSVARVKADEPLELDVDEQNKAARAVYDRLGWIELTGANRRPRAGQIRLISR